MRSASVRHQVHTTNKGSQIVLPHRDVGKWQHGGVDRQCKQGSYSRAGKVMTGTGPRLGSSRGVVWGCYAILLEANSGPVLPMLVLAGVASAARLGQVW